MSDLRTRIAAALAKVVVDQNLDVRHHALYDLADAVIAELGLRKQSQTGEIVNIIEGDGINYGRHRYVTDWNTMTEKPIISPDQTESARYSADRTLTQSDTHSDPKPGTVIATAIGDEYMWNGETWMLRYRTGYNEFGPWHNINWRDAIRAVGHD